LRLTHQTQPRKTAQTIPKAENENMKCVVVFQKPILRSMKFPDTVGDGSKVENRDGSKVNSDKLKGKMAEDVGPYQIGRFLKDPDFGLRVIKDGYGLFKGWSNFVGSAFEFNGMIYGDFSGRSQGEMQVEEG